MRQISILLLKVAQLPKSFILGMRNGHTQESRQMKLVYQVPKGMFVYKPACLRRHGHLTNRGTVTSLNRSIAQGAPES